MRVAQAVIVMLAMVPLACAQDNLITGEKINGYTGVPFDTRNSPYDYLVDSSLVRDDPSRKEFKTLQAAYEAVPAGTAYKPTVIGIRPDVYFIRGTETTAGLTITKNYITLLGLTDDRRKVVFADDRGHLQGAKDNGYMFTVNAIGFSAINVSFVNYCNMDYEYPGDPTKNLKRRTPYDSQAVSMQMRGDKHVFSHVAFLSRHDTIYLQTLRSYFTNVYVEGTEDFLGVGAGIVSVWKDSEVYFPTSTGVMFAPGVIFINTVFKASHGMSFYKGFTTPVALIDCTVPVSTPQSPTSWLLAKPPKGARFFSLTYHTKDAKGNPAVIFDSNVGPPSFALSRELSDEEAAAFNPWNLLRATTTGVADDWDPAGAMQHNAAHGNDAFRMRFVADLTAAEKDAAAPQRSYTELFLPPVIHTGGPAAALNALVYPTRTGSDAIVWSTTSGAISLDRRSGRTVMVTARNNTDHAVDATVTATAPNGFYITTTIKVEPAYLPAPSLSRPPSLTIFPDGKARVDYAFSSPAKDMSGITWYLCEEAQCAARRKVAISRGDVPLKEYALSGGAVGRYVEAEIEPRLERSETGVVTDVISARMVAAGDLKGSTVSPNFRNFVETPSATYVSGMWTVLGPWQSVSNDNLLYWQSPSGEDLVNGYGLKVAAPTGGLLRGSLLYQNDAPTGDMQVKVVLTPDKIGGDGFGAPSTPDDGDDVQSIDIFIKYDPRTRTGYALRFWHTIPSANTCMFQLYKIENGKGSPLSDKQQLTGVYKPNTTFILSVAGSTLTARAANNMDSDTLSLQSTITPNQFGGAGVSIPGTVWMGNSSTVSEFEISYH